jgi:alginate O-acetyltransferase complex protein AlgI
MVGWVFFRAETLPGTIAFLASMAGLTAAVPTPYSVGWYLTPELWIALVAGAIGSAPWVPALAARLDDRQPGLALLNTAALMALLVLSIMSMAARTYNPFIYFRF